MLLTKTWIYGKMSTDAGILSVIGSTDNIIDMYPEAFLSFPIMSYQDDNQADGEYRDNKPSMTRQRFRIDIFTKLDGPYTNSAIGQKVAEFFTALDFNCGSNSEVMEPTEGVRHRVMRFSRELFASDLI
jgi:hypothetical protein